jgi:hypothetical protein
VRVNDVLALVQHPGGFAAYHALPGYGGHRASMYNHLPFPEDLMEVLSPTHPLFALTVRSRNDAPHVLSLSSTGASAISI